MHCFPFCSFSGIASGGYLQLNPNLKETIQHAGPDRSFFISCLPHALNAPVADSRVRARELRWQKYQAPPFGRGWVVMGSEPHERIHVEQSSDGRGLDLVFRSINPEDAGRYSCAATLDDIEEHEEFKLTVVEGISFDLTPKVQSVEVGTKEFTLVCKVTGNPEPQITWNLRGDILRPKDIIPSDSKYAVSDKGLIIRNITKADQGSYKCKATQFESGIVDFQDLVINLKVQRKLLIFISYLITFRQE